MPRRRSYFFPKRTLRTRSNRQPRSIKPARFAPTTLRAYLDGLSDIVTQFLSPVLGTMPVTRPANHPQPERRAALVRELRVAASVAGHGER